MVRIATCVLAVACDDLAPGEHTVTISADGYVTPTREATAVEGIMIPVEVQLVAKPAVIAVSAPAGAQVAIDTHAVGDAPVARAEVPAGRHLIVVAQRGGVPFVREVELAPIVGDKSAGVAIGGRF